MPQNYPDPDEWMRKQAKTPAPQVSAPAMDPDEWMRRQTQPEQRQAPRAYIPPTERQEFGRARLPEFGSASRFTFNRPRVSGPDDPTNPLFPPSTRRHSTPKNLGLGVEQETYGSFVPAAVTGLEALGSAMTGDFGPAGEIGEQALRGVGQLMMGGNPSFAGPARANREAIERITAERRARQGESPITSAIEQAQADVEAEASQDPSLRGRITRGVGRYATAAAPVVITGALTGGSLPAIAGVTAAQSLDAPENMGVNVGLASLPIPALRRVKGGRDAAARATGEFPEVRPTSRLPQSEPLYPDAPPTAEMPAVSVRSTAALPRSTPYDVESMPTAGLPALESGGLPEIRSAPLPSLRLRETGPTSAASASVQGPSVTPELSLSATARNLPEPASFGRPVGNAIRIGAQAFRTIRTAFDLSAVYNQGAFLTRAHPLHGARAFGKMLRSLSKTQSQAIDDAVINHPLKPLADDFGLHIATGGPPEEAFMLKALNKVPGISHSERTYRTYLDSLRMSTWETYVKSLQSRGFTPDNAPMAYKQAADFINIATGRGALRKGGMIEKATEIAGVAAFAPRNWISRWQLLDPVRYATLQPGARKLVLRDAMTSFGTILGTAALLRASGITVSLDPRDDNFLEARWGNHRYDLTGGLKTEVKFLAKMTKGVHNQANGEGNLPGSDPLSVASTYSRGKLSPAAGLVYDALKGEDFRGRTFAEKSPLQIATEFGPMITEDFYEAYQDSGWTGVAKSSPAFIGQRVGVYPDRAKAQWLDEPPAWREERKKAGEPRMFLGPKRARPKDKTEKDETPQEFGARLERVNELLGKYGPRLVASGVYRRATVEEKAAAREYLRRQIGRQDLNVEQLDPFAIFESVRESAYRKAEKRTGMNR